VTSDPAAQKICVPDRGIRSMSERCCQVVYFQTKNPNLSKFLECLAIEYIGIFMALLSILRPNGILYCYLVHFGIFGMSDSHSVYLMTIRYI
jgi:hypothetical protein